MFAYCVRKSQVRFCMLFLFAFTFARAQSPAFVHRSGRTLIDSAGQTVQLRGINLGGWLLWEGWMWGSGLKSQSKVTRRLEELAGKQATDSFRTAVFYTLVAEADIQAIAAGGFNVVRIPFNHRLFAFTGDSVSPASEGFRIIDRVLGWCRKYGVYAILDMHAAPGGQSRFFIADHTRHQKLWNSEASRLKTILLWKAIAAHYANKRSVAGYDLLNEPVPHPDAKLSALYVRIIAAIRQIDKQHLLFLEGAGFARRFKIFRSLPDSNMAFSFHIYTWLGGDAAKKVKSFAMLSRKLNVPVWCGEWGENNYEIILHTRTALENPDNGFCGWAYWSWKRTHTRFPNINEIETGPEWKKMMRWMKTKDHAYRTSTEETRAGMKQFLYACRYENLRQDKNMYELLRIKK
jgi:endoglucanase